MEKTTFVKSWMLASLLGFFFFTTPALAQNQANGNCYTSRGSSYYLSAYAGQKRMDEIRVCDESSGNYTQRGSCPGVNYYVSNHHVKQIEKWQAKQWKIVMLRKDTSGKVLQICRFN